MPKEVNVQATATHAAGFSVRRLPFSGRGTNPFSTWYSFPRFIENGVSSSIVVFRRTLLGEPAAFSPRSEMKTLYLVPLWSVERIIVSAVGCRPPVFP